MIFINSFITLNYVIRLLTHLKWTEKTLQEYQNECIQRVVKNAYENVPFYHKVFQAADISPSDIKTVADLNKIPMIRKTDLKKVAVTDLISKKKEISRLKKITTGGSTGKPFSMYLDVYEEAWRRAVNLRAKIVCGQKQRDRWITISDEYLGNHSSKLQRLLKFYVRSVIPVTLDRGLRFRMVQEINPQILDGFPSAIYLLAKDYEQYGGSPITPKLVFGSGELVDHHTVEYIEKAFATTYLDQYGCTEVYRAAWQCNQKQGYHMDVDSVIMQFVDEAGNEVGPGEEGEIVYTSLFNYAFPIIRYNIEDVGIPSRERCSCGNILPLMDIIKGRANSFLVFPNHQIISPFNFIEQLGAYRLEKEIEEYKVIQEKIDYIRIIIKKTSETIEEEKLKRVLFYNLAELRSNYSDVIFNVEFVDKIDRTCRGKLNVISSNLSECQRCF